MKDVVRFEIRNTLNKIKKNFKLSLIRFEHILSKIH